MRSVATRDIEFQSLASKRSSSPLRQGRSLSPLPAANATNLGRVKFPRIFTAASETMMAARSPMLTGSPAANLGEGETRPEPASSVSSPSSRMKVPVGISRLLRTRPTMQQENDKVWGSELESLGSRPKAKKTDIKGKVMSDVFVAQSLLKDAFPLRRYGKLDNVFFEACRFVNRLVHKDFTHRRARSIWEGTARRIDAEEMEALKMALIRESQREAAELRARLASLDEKIAAFEKGVAREAVAKQG